MAENSECSVTPFLMFTGKADEAMRFYVDLFDESEIREVKYYGPGEQGPEGTVHQAEFVISGQRLMCIDSPPVHDFTFTPSISLFVTSPDEAKIISYFEKLSEGGAVLMPLDSYPFSRKYAWVTDRFGVSWQLSAS
jgi:predicted 3-demethylubiquinone-9 3-methyltransferase (glyoxalase superfamily)